MSQADPLRRIPFLDGLRAMAALMVMVFHFVGHHGERRLLVQASGIGQTGVDLFFVLSGFLITRILCLSKTSTHYFSHFYARRTLRIFPLYYGFLALYFFLLPPLYHLPIPSFRSQLWSWFYLENLPSTFSGLLSTGPGHFWSLAIEEQFYLVWPLMVYLLSRRNFSLLVGMTLLIPPLVRFAFLTHNLPVFYFTLTRMDALGFGALLALISLDPQFGSVSQLRLFRWLLGALLIFLPPSFVFLSGSQLIWLQVIKQSLIPAFYFALIGFCLGDPLARPLIRLFSISWLRWLGAISYGLYVFHPTCFELVERFIHPGDYILDVTLSFGLTILVADLSFRYFESPIIRLKRRFSYEVPPAAAESASSSPAELDGSATPLRAPAKP